MAQHEELCDHSAHRVAHHVRGVDAALVEHAGGVVGHLVEVIPAFRLVRAAHSTVVEADRAVAGRERDALADPRRAIRAESLDHEHRRCTGPPDHVERELRAVGREDVAHARWSIISWISARTASIVSAIASGPAPSVVRRETGAPMWTVQRRPISRPVTATGKTGTPSSTAGARVSRRMCPTRAPRRTWRSRNTSAICPAREHSRELVGTILHSAHAPQHRSDGCDVGNAEHPHHAAGRTPDAPGDRERFGHAEPTVRDEHRGPLVGDVLGTGDSRVRARGEKRVEHRDEVGVETPLVHDVGAVEPAADDVAHAASSAGRSCVTVAHS